MTNDAAPYDEQSALLPRQGGPEMHRRGSGAMGKKMIGVFLVVVVVVVVAASIFVLLSQRPPGKTTSAPSCPQHPDTTTLQLKYEQRMQDLFGNAEPKYETSSVIVVQDVGTPGTRAFAICDSSWSLFEFGIDDISQPSSFDADETVVVW